MRNLFLMVKEDFINLIKNPMWVFYSTAFPVLLIVILGYLTGSAYGDTITSYDYYGITLMIYAILSSGMTSANAFMEERIKKPNMRIVYAPGSVKNIFISKIIATFGFSIILHIIDIIFLHFCFHVIIGNPLYLLILFGVTELFSVTLGIMICCIVKSESTTNQIQSIVVNILAILGGVLFSLDSYGSTAIKISMISPVKWIVQSSFQMIYDKDMHLFLPTLMFLGISILVMLVICNITFRKEDCIC